MFYWTFYGMCNIWTIWHFSRAEYTPERYVWHSLHKHHLKWRPKLIWRNIFFISRITIFWYEFERKHLYYWTFCVFSEAFDGWACQRVLPHYALDADCDELDGIISGLSSARNKWRSWQFPYVIHISRAEHTPEHSLHKP